MTPELKGMEGDVRLADVHELATCSTANERPRPERVGGIIHRRTAHRVHGDHNVTAAAP